MCDGVKACKSCNANSKKYKISGTMKNKVSYQLVGGAILSGYMANQASNMIKNLVAKDETDAKKVANYVGGAKMVLGVLGLMYGGKSQLTQGASMGIIASGATDISNGMAIGAVRAGRLGVSPTAHHNRKHTVLGLGTGNVPENLDLRQPVPVRRMATV